MTLCSHYDPLVGTDVPPETLDNACLAACLPGFVDVWPALRPAEPGYTFDSAANEMLPRYEQMRYDRLMARLPSAARGWRPAAVELVGAAPCPAGPAPAGDRRALLRLRGLPLDVGYEDVLRWVRAAAAGGGAAAEAGGGWDRPAAVAFGHDRCLRGIGPGARPEGDTLWATVELPPRVLQSALDGEAAGGAVKGRVPAVDSCGWVEGRPAPPAWPSDHFGVLATLEWREA